MAIRVVPLVKYAINNSGDKEYKHLVNKYQFKYLLYVSFSWSSSIKDHGAEKVFQHYITQCAH